MKKVAILLFLQARAQTSGGIRKLEAEATETCKNHH